jgi:cobalt-zinc-cadmium efflux system membrane fusion protein
MTSDRILSGLSACLVLCLAGCGGVPSAKTEAEGTPGKNAASSAEGIKLDGGLASRLKWHVVTERRLPRSLTVAGRVEFNEDQTARVLAPVAGQVADLNVRIGDEVSKGQVLFSLRSREVAQLMTEYLESRRDLDLSQKTLAMTKDLFDHQAASRISLQQAENDVAKNRAKLARTGESLKLFGLAAPADEASAGLDTPIAVRSPLTGTVVERSVTAGQFVQPESGALLTVADMSAVLVLAEVFERDVRFVRPGLRGDVTTTAYPDRKFTAKVARLHDVVDEETRTVKVRFLVSNPDRSLKPEMFASVSLFLADSEPALTVPAAAVITEGGENHVYVQAGEGRILKRRVELSTEGGSDLRVRNGLHAGDRIVAEGTLLVRQLERGGEPR